MYGYRARIGYCSPPALTEVFCTEFYMMAPRGVTVMLTTLDVTTLTSPSTPEQMQRSYERSVEAARAMARAGADVVVLGGNPINQSRGLESLADICRDFSAEIGVPVITSSQAQIAALKSLGAINVATVHPFIASLDERAQRSIRNLGFNPTGAIACGYDVEQLGSIPSDLVLSLSRKVKKENPEADTIHPSCAHWATAHAIDQIEYELDVNVMTSQQAIFWLALRTAGISDHIPGFGRLLREF